MAEMIRCVPFDEMALPGEAAFDGGKVCWVPLQQIRALVWDPEHRGYRVKVAWNPIETFFFLGEIRDGLYTITGEEWKPKRFNERTEKKRR